MTLEAKAHQNRVEPGQNAFGIDEPEDVQREDKRDKGQHKTHQSALVMMTFIMTVLQSCSPAQHDYRSEKDPPQPREYPRVLRRKVYYFHFQSPAAVSGYDYDIVI
jgi:hypothetical protein